MTNKNQLIKEMANDMDYATIQHDLWPDDTKEIAKTLIMLGYRKVPEGSLIVTNDNAEELANVIVTSPQMQSVMSNLIKVWQKEAAEKILNEQYQECKVAERDVLIARGGNKNDDYYKGFSLGMANTKMHIQELAKQFDVEIQEEDNG